MQSEATDEHRAFLSVARPGRSQVRFALTAVAVSAAMFLVTAPFATRSIGPVPAFIPAYESALVISDVITAVLLFSQFNVIRSKPLLVIAGGYLFTAVIALSHMLMFPGAFSSTGLLGAGPQSAAWLWTFWHSGFPLAVILYALLGIEERKTIARAETSARPRGGASVSIVWAVAVSVGVACGLAWVAATSRNVLPTLITNGQFTLSAHLLWDVGWMTSLIALAVLWWRRPHTVLDLWLMIVMCAWTFDITLTAIVNSGRFDIGWYASRVYGVVAAGSLLIVLLIENSSHYARLAQTERRYRGLLEAAPDAIVVVNQHGEIVLLNLQAEKRFGYPRDELVGQQVTKVIPDGFAERLIADSNRTPAEALAQEIGAGIELIGRRRDGSAFPIELMLSPLANAEDTLVTAAIRDITTRKQTEAELLLNVKELKRSNEELGQFAYIASHDLQEPLRMVISYTRLLSKRYKGKLDADADEFLAFAADAATRMQTLISDLLAYSRVGKIGIAMLPTSSEAALQQGLRNLRGAIDDSGALVTHDPLPSVLANAPQLVQLFQNLVGNAIKYQSPGVPRVHVSATRNESREWAFSVRDNGLGIDSKDFERIFGMFQRLHGREQFAGTGIGLAICKKIVERHGGEISVESQPGAGSTFRFALAATETAP